jgi:hypothetical protein
MRIRAIHRSAIAAATIGECTAIPNLASPRSLCWDKPTFTFPLGDRMPRQVLDREVVCGQDRIELLADALKSGRAPYRPQV